MLLKYLVQNFALYSTFLLFQNYWDQVRHVVSINKLISCFFKHFSEVLYFAQWNCSSKETFYHFNMLYLVFHQQCFSSSMYFTVMMLDCFGNTFCLLILAFNASLLFLCLTRFNMILYSALFHINFFPASIAEELSTRYTKVFTFNPLRTRKF